MGNTGYCRFHNTALYLKECIAYWDDDLSEDEAKAKADILALAKYIVKFDADGGDDDE